MSYNSHSERSEEITDTHRLIDRKIERERERQRKRCTVYYTGWPISKKWGFGLLEYCGSRSGVLASLRSGVLEVRSVS
ncbi:hypothetical protein FHG87_010882 [Trinorchestia longiramus]|nr:hypothetical protein FHG87_010882 [Trinorchestia longiramus]